MGSLFTGILEALAAKVKSQHRFRRCGLFDLPMGFVEPEDAMWRRKFAEEHGLQVDRPRRSLGDHQQRKRRRRHPILTPRKEHEQGKWLPILNRFLGSDDTRMQDVWSKSVVQPPS